MKKNINLVIDDNAPSVGGVNVNMDSLDKISNGSIDSIMCLVLDSFEYDDRKNKLISILKKIKNGGELTIRFADTKKIMIDFVNNKLSSEQLSKIISQTNSLNTESDILELLSINNQFSIMKMYNDNNYLIMVIKKTL
jgi:hypothetical protein